MLRRAIIKNYKGLKATDIEFDGELNILVGDNETGKSTVLEAINLGLTAQLNRRSVSYELHPFLFNQEVVNEYISALQSSETVPPPEISIELFFSDEDHLARLKGDNNSQREDCPGVCLRIALDDDLADKYAACVKEPSRLTMIPVEYYGIVWEGFDGNGVKLRSMPVRPILIDPSAATNAYAANRYVLEVARDFLSPAEQAELALSYRTMRSAFHNDAGVTAVNSKLEAESGLVSEKRLSVALDMTAKATWEGSVLPHLDDLPLSQAGKGEQNAVKIKLALKSHKDCEIILIEEPENHLSHANLGKLLKEIEDRADERQLIIATHSSFVLNKLGVHHTLMFNGKTAVRLNNLPEDTYDYFMKLPGHDTLRMVLAQRTIFVEGPSDELIVQRAYKQKHGKLPLEDGVEVIAVNSLAFKRFLDIARLLELDVVVATDNDGNPEAVASKYSDYEDCSFIRICYSQDASLGTLEPHLFVANGREKLNRMLDKTYEEDESLLAYMDGNKTEVALALFESGEEVGIPGYINDAVG